MTQVRLPPPGALAALRRQTARLEAAEPAAACDFPPQSRAEGGGGGLSLRVLFGLACAAAGLGLAAVNLLTLRILKVQEASGGDRLPYQRATARNDLAALLVGVTFVLLVYCVDALAPPANSSRVARLSKGLVSATIRLCYIAIFATGITNSLLLAAASWDRHLSLSQLRIGYFKTPEYRAQSRRVIRTAGGVSTWRLWAHCLGRALLREAEDPSVGWQSDCQAYVVSFVTPNLCLVWGLQAGALWLATATALVFLRTYRRAMRQKTNSNHHSNRQMGSLLLAEVGISAAAFAAFALPYAGLGGLLGELAIIATNAVALVSNFASFAFLSAAFRKDLRSRFTALKTHPRRIGPAN